MCNDVIYQDYIEIIACNSLKYIGIFFLVLMCCIHTVDDMPTNLNLGENELWWLFVCSAVFFIATELGKYCDLNQGLILWFCLFLQPFYLQHVLCLSLSKVLSACGRDKNFQEVLKVDKSSRALNTSNSIGNCRPHLNLEQKNPFRGVLVLNFVFMTFSILGMMRLRGQNIISRE